MTKHETPQVLGRKQTGQTIAVVVKRLSPVIILVLAVPLASIATASPIARVAATNMAAVATPICSLCQTTGHCKCRRAQSTTYTGGCGAGFLNYVMSQQSADDKCITCASNSHPEALNWRTGHNEIDLLLIRLTACVNRQNHSGVIKTAEELGRRGGGSPSYFYAAARGYAMIVAPQPDGEVVEEKSVVVKQPDGRTAPGATAEEIAAGPADMEPQAGASGLKQQKQNAQASFTQRAIHFLQQAERMGYFDAPSRVEQLHGDNAFKSLRSEPQFVRFLQLISPKTGMPPMPGDELPASPPEMIPAE